MDVCVENKCLPWISFLRSEGIFHKVIKDLKGPKNQIYILNNLEKFRHLLSKSKDNRVFIINERFKKNLGKLVLIL